MSRIWVYAAVRLRPRIVAGAPQQSTAAGVPLLREVRSFLLMCFIFVTLTPRWCCGAAEGQSDRRPPIAAFSGVIVRPQPTVKGGWRGDTWPSGLDRGMQREHGRSSTAVGSALAGGGGAGTRPQPLKVYNRILKTRTTQKQNSVLIK